MDVPAEPLMKVFRLNCFLLPNQFSFCVLAIWIIDEQWTHHTYKLILILTLPYIYLILTFCISVERIERFSSIFHAFKDILFWYYIYCCELLWECSMQFHVYEISSYNIRKSMKVQLSFECRSLTQIPLNWTGFVRNLPYSKTNIRLI